MLKLFLLLHPLLTNSMISILRLLWRHSRSKSMHQTSYFWRLLHKSNGKMFWQFHRTAHFNCPKHGRNLMRKFQLKRRYRKSRYEKLFPQWIFDKDIYSFSFCLLQILWWLAWLGQRKLENLSISHISEKIFEILENKFGVAKVKYLITLITASRDGLLETEIIDMLQNSKIVEGMRNFVDKKIEKKGHCFILKDL